VRNVLLGGGEKEKDSDIEENAEDLK